MSASANLNDANLWNARYQQILDQPRPSQVVLQNLHLIPQQGSALDLASGLGGNALLLASHGLHTRAWDLSDVAIQRLNLQASSLDLPLLAEVRDVIASPPEPNSFDCIVVSRFLHRTLAQPIIDALKPGALLLYQTFTVEKKPSVGPSRHDFLLGVNELLRMFAGLRLLVYREEGRQGNGDLGWRNEAMFVGRKNRLEEEY
ncbi:MAG: class I SAM-dependent methyltransferase [Magnetococcales bacterium]|nr:class I SAM-dependent methyltransferase [Magnetococcales bacterium]